jgi:hypothetical protein
MLSLGARRESVCEPGSFRRKRHLLHRHQRKPEVEVEERVGS